MKLLVAGDTHGSLYHAEYLTQKAVEHQCSTIVQLGDWGYTWPGWGKLPKLNEVLAKYDMPMLFIDGNHENFPDLVGRGAWATDHMTPFLDASYVQYIPRGHIWVWDTVTFMAMGGAWSIDQDMRTPGHSWWPEETISSNDFHRALFNLDSMGLLGEIDVFLSHDAPFGVPKLEANLADYDFKLKLESRHIRGSQANRKALLGIVEQARPKALYHGHLHWHYTDTLALNDREVTVTGLAHDGDPDRSWAVLDTADFH